MEILSRETYTTCYQWDPQDYICAQVLFKQYQTQNLLLCLPKYFGATASAQLYTYFAYIVSCGWQKGDLPSPLRQLQLVTQVSYGQSCTLVCGTRTSYACPASSVLVFMKSTNFPPNNHDIFLFQIQKFIEGFRLSKFPEYTSSKPKILMCFPQNLCFLYVE